MCLWRKPKNGIRGFWAHLHFSPKHIKDWKQLEQLIKTTFSIFGGQPPADLEAGRSCARIF